MRKNCERLFRSKSVDPKQPKVATSSHDLGPKTKSKSKPRISTARRIAFNPCFSPTVSDDEFSPHEEEANNPTSSNSASKECFQNPFRNKNDRASMPPPETSGTSASQSASSSQSMLPRPIANVAENALKAARDLRARLALAAHADNQQHGPGALRRASTAMASSNPIPGLTPERKNVHTVVEYTNVLIPDLVTILNAAYYWGTMDRYEAEKLLEGKPEGTFLLRDSAQINYVFSVSFRRYQRTLHARIEQSDGKFSFDIHDNTVFSAKKITDLIENYKDPARCLFFEPQLSVPLIRNYVFSLKEFSRAIVAGCCTYDSAHDLPLPTHLKKFVREYHYKQAVRVTDKDSA